MRRFPSLRVARTRAQFAPYGSRRPLYSIHHRSAVIAGASLPRLTCASPFGRKGHPLSTRISDSTPPLAKRLSRTKPHGLLRCLASRRGTPTIAERLMVQLAWANACPPPLADNPIPGSACHSSDGRPAFAIRRFRLKWTAGTWIRGNGDRRRRDGILRTTFHTSVPHLRQETRLISSPGFPCLGAPAADKDTMAWRLPRRYSPGNADSYEDRASTSYHFPLLEVMTTANAPNHGQYPMPRAIALRTGAGSRWPESVVQHPVTPCAKEDPTRKAAHGTIKFAVLTRERGSRPRKPGASFHAMRGWYSGRSPLVSTGLRKRHASRSPAPRISGNSG